MRASVVKSPEHSGFAKHTSTECRRSGPPAQKRGTRKRPSRSLEANASPTGAERQTDTILSWRLLWSVASQATTNSYTCQPQAADHQMTYALRSASRSSEASEPHLANGFL